MSENDFRSTRVMDTLIRSFDWSSTPLGPSCDWSQSLKTAVNIMLGSRQPALIAWGAKRTCLYNDAYIPILCRKHPNALGKPLRDVYSDTWDTLKPFVDITYSGKPQYFRDKPLTMPCRPDQPPIYLSSTWTPIHDDDGAIGGFYCDSNVTTDFLERLTESEDRRRLAESAAHIGIHDINILNNSIYWNDQIRQMWGISPDEPVTHETFLSYIHPEDRKQVQQAVDAATDPAGNGRYFAEYRINPRDGGKTRWIAATGQVYFSDGRAYRLVGTAQDITERKESEERLRESEERFRLAADAVSGIIYEYDTITNRVERSTGLFRVLGFMPNDADPTVDWWKNRIHPDDIQNFLLGTEQNGRLSIEYRIKHRDGRWIYVWDRSLVVCDSTGRVTKRVGCVIDITKTRKHQRSLIQSRKELEKLVDKRTKELIGRARQLSRLTSQLTLTEQRERRRLSVVLHDHLQQILVAARMNLQAAVNTLKLSGNDHLKRVASLISEAVAESRNLSVELSPPVLHESGLLAGLRWLAGWMETKHGLSVHLTLQEDADPDREDVSILVFESVRELLFNVVKHSGTMEASLSAIQTDKQTITISVEDNGSGFDVKSLEEPDSDDGSTFGLFSIRERLTILGGSMECQSSPGKGSRFTLTVPLGQKREPKKQDSFIQSKSEQTPPRNSYWVSWKDAKEPIRILLVDDHEVVREGLTILIESMPDMIVAGTASSGTEGIELARILSPDIVLMDYSLPGIDGVKATRLIREEMPHVKIIGLSMHDTTDNAEAMLGAGAASYLSKGGSSSLLIEEIRNVFGRRPRYPLRNTR
ncbi:MAG: PAS domain-containing protein [Spirochaetota bacterium]